MESLIVKNLKPKYQPVGLIWSNTIEKKAVMFKKGRFACTLHLFAQACIKGKTTAGSRETIACGGGKAALGFGVDLDSSEERLNIHSALFSKGAESAMDPAAYEKKLKSIPETWQSMYRLGERRHADSELARNWIVNELPRYDIPWEYVVFKPLSKIDPSENLRSVIFPVNPLELSGLVMLAGSLMTGTDPVQVPQGADCNSITSFVYAQEDSKQLRAVLGMLGMDGREFMRKRFQDDIVTLSLPISLFNLMEKEADDSVFKIPAWKTLKKI